MLTNQIECTHCNGSGLIFVEDLKTNQECPYCDFGTIEESIGDEKIVFLNIYSVTRHYGGPEEGGWWYNWYECIESIPVQNQYSDLMKETVIEQNESKKYGNIYSVLGGRDIDVRIEATPKESETKEIPHYE